MCAGTSRENKAPAVMSSTSPFSSGTSTQLISLSDGNHAATELTKSLAQEDTRVVTFLRFAVLSVLLITAIVVSTGVYLYTRNDERQSFEDHFDEAARQVIDTFHQAVERNIGAIAALSASITSYANHSQPEGFPFVTLPDFELLGSNYRTISGSHLLSWCPLVTEGTREAWEEYSLQNRLHSAEAYRKDTQYRTEQDEEFGHMVDPNKRKRTRQLEDTKGIADTLGSDSIRAPGLSVLDDGTFFHPKIWTTGERGPEPGDEPEGGGPYLPVWQQSPVDAFQQATLNLNLASTRYVTPDLIETMTREKKAVLNYSVKATPRETTYAEKFLSLSQYRVSDPELFGDWHTLLTYPVFDSFEEDRNVVGLISTDIYWKVLFSKIIASNTEGIIVIVENSVGQSMAFQIDGHKVTSLGEGDPHEEQYDSMMVANNLNTLWDDRACVDTRAYKSVPLSDSVQYTIRVFPSTTTEDRFLTYRPLAYTLITMFAFFFASFLFLFYSFVVERRHNAMAEKVIEQVKKAAETERELNEFLSHEIRNPLSAALSAVCLIESAVNEAHPLRDEETRKNVREDVEVISSSLNFVNDFLRSMLDIYRAAGNQITVQKSPVDILEDILKPVSHILYTRLISFEVRVDCPANMIVMTDAIRLKQVILNLVRNASKFVEKGFLQIRADLVDNHVRIYVEDSGPGVPLDKQRELFAKYQASLDLLSQGTGIGLNLSKKLMGIMDGDLWLDETYDSGIEGCPGACFVVDLKMPIMEFSDDGDTDVEIGAKLADKLDSSSTSTTDPSSRDSDLPIPPVPPGKPTDMELPDDISVLFVDDDAMLRKLFTRAIKRVVPESWTIREASSGETALKLCETEHFCLIFLDQYMASVDKQLLGTETVRSMRSMGIQSKICGLSANDLRTAFINCGADDFILKPMPCKPPELKRTLSRILSTSKERCTGHGTRHVGMIGRELEHLPEDTV